jgi:hypothetical protein
MSGELLPTEGAAVHGKPSRAVSPRSHARYTAASMPELHWTPIGRLIAALLLTWLVVRAISAKADARRQRDREARMDALLEQAAQLREATTGETRGRWHCDCGHDNDRDATSCAACGKELGA